MTEPINQEALDPGRPYDEGELDDLFGMLGPSRTIRCKNYELDPAMCGETCGVELPLAAFRDGRWITLLLEEAPEWFVMLRSCTEHGRHADPYCSVGCFQSYHASHEHPHHA